jgi:hypothetical protein
MKYILDTSRKQKYKVIKRRTRTSAILHGNSKYARKYLPGDIVTAMEGTHGIFVFKTKAAAEDWASIWNGYHSIDGEKDLIVVPVIPIGRGRTLVFVCSGIESNLLDEYYASDDDLYGTTGEAPDNTMGYPAVYVLE